MTDAELSARELRSALAAATERAHRLGEKCVRLWDLLHAAAPLITDAELSSYQRREKLYERITRALDEGAT